MNVELLLRVKEQILAEPSRFEMYTWFADITDDITGVTCGTAACIGGWAWQLSGNRSDDWFGSHQIMEELQLNGDQMDKLCLISCWPVELSNRYNDASENSLLAAQIAAERIDLFIRTDGEE